MTTPLSNSETYKKLAKEFGCLFSVGKYGFQVLPKNPLGKPYKLFQIIPLDGWTSDPHEIMQAMFDDPDFDVVIQQEEAK